MEIIRGRLSAADFSNPSQRYNEDTDTFQYTPDNGANWYDSPEADPRHSNIFRLPPLGTSDPQCDAAANMVKWIKDFIDSVIEQLNADAQALALTNSFLTRFATLFPPALLLLLLQEAATSLFDTGATALDAAFTSTQYDLLLCAFYCNIEGNGTVTAADLLKVETQIAATMDTAAALIVAEILFIQGEVGLSNAGVIGGQTGDCSDCNCEWEGCVDFTLEDGGFSVYVSGANTYGTWVSGTGWRSNYFPAPSYNNVQDVIIGRSFDAVVLTEIEWSVTYLNHSAPQAYLYSDFPPTEYIGPVLTWTGNETWDGIAINANEELCTSTQYVIATRLRMKGFGDRPTWLSDC